MYRDVANAALTSWLICVEIKADAKMLADGERRRIQEQSPPSAKNALAWITVQGMLSNTISAALLAIISNSWSKPEQWSYKIIFAYTEV